MEKTIKISVGEAVVKFLDNQYISYDGEESKFVEGFYTLFGHGCVLGVGEALAMSAHSLKVYQGKNEQGMALAAMSYAKQNNRRKIIPCVSSIGPGSANMVTASACATVNNIPLLLFLGDTFATRRPDPVLQQLEQPYDLNITTNDAFKPVVKFFDRISRPEMLASSLTNAMRVLTDTAATGAVALALPQDVQGEAYNFPCSLFNKKVWKITRIIPSEEELAEAVSAIKKAKHPLIIVGGGARYSEAGAVISELCEKCGIPLAETQAGKSVVCGSAAYNLGGIGVTGNLAANMVAQKADLIIGIGTRFSDFTTSSKTLFKKANVIAINTSAFHADKLNGIRVVGDAKATVSALIPLLKKYKTKYTNEVAQAKQKWQAEYARLSQIEYSDNLATEVGAKTATTVADFHRASGASLCQTTALACIRELIAKDAIVVGASGSLPGCMQRMWTTDSPYSYNMEYGFSCMGYEIAGAFGAKLACPDREVYAMVGDGSYLMLHSEIVTALQENKKIIILLFDNGGFGCINNLQMSKGVSSLATEFRYNAEASTPFVPIDYAMCARGYGCEGYTAHNLEELKVALAKARQAEKVALVDIKVAPKTMTDGYEGGWWQVGCTRAVRNDMEKDALIDQFEHIFG